MTTIISVDPTTASYTLPVGLLGVKTLDFGIEPVTGNSVFTTGTHRGVAVKTIEGLTFRQVIQDLDPDTIAQSDGGPWAKGGNYIAVYWDAVYALQKWHVQTNGGYLSPHIVTAGIHNIGGDNTAMSNPSNTQGSPGPDAPENPLNVPPSGTGAGTWSRESIKTLFDTISSDVGIDKVIEVEFYNEPGTNLGGIYAIAGDPDSQASKLAAARFYTNIHRYFYDYFKTQFPSLHMHGGSYAAGTDNNLGNGQAGGDIDEFLHGYSGWRWAGSTDNVSHIDGYSLHSYFDTGALRGNPQGQMNTIFYPTLKVGPAHETPIGGFKAAYDTWRAKLTAAGSSSLTLAMTEAWWHARSLTASGAYMMDNDDPRLGWLDIGGMICTMQNQAAWNMKTYLTFAIGCTDMTGNIFFTEDLMYGARQDAAVAVGNRLFRSTRHWGAKLGHLFGNRNGYRSIVPSVVSGGRTTAASAWNNAVQCIQPIAGVKASNGHLGILVLNADLNASEQVTIQLTRPTSSVVTATIYPNNIGLDGVVPGTSTRGLQTNSNVAASGVSSFDYVIQPGSAVLFDMSYSGSAPTSTPPANLVIPTISGTAQSGQTLTAGNGTWSNTPTSYTYRWLRCDSQGNNAAAISAATASTYAAVAADIGSTIRLEVTAVNAGGSATAVSAATSLVAAASTSKTFGRTTVGSAFADIAGSYCWVTGPFTLSEVAQLAKLSEYVRGGPAVGSHRPVVYANAAGEPGAFVAAGTAVAIAANQASGWVDMPFPAIPTLTAGSYWLGVLCESTVNHQTAYTSGSGLTRFKGMTFVASGDPQGGATFGAATSDTHGWSIYATYNTPTGTPPTNTAVPTVSGTLYVGDTLTAADGTWTGSPSLTRQWQRVDLSTGQATDIPAATSTTYVSVSADIGYGIRVVVTGTNSDGAVTANSANTTAIASPVPLNLVVPALSGTTDTGSTLTSDSGTWIGKASITYAYQWQRDTDGTATTFADIASATAATHVIVVGDETFRVRCKVTATNGSGSTVAYSAPTTVISSSPTAPVNTVVPAITGTALVGQTLTAGHGTFTGSATINYTYQWQKAANGSNSFSNIAGSTSTTYAVVSGDQGYRFQVVVTATNGTGSAVSTSAPTGSVPTAHVTNPYLLAAISKRAALGTRDDFFTDILDDILALLTDLDANDRLPSG